MSHYSGPGKLLERDGCLHKGRWFSSSFCLATGMHRCGKGRESGKGSWLPQRPSWRQLTDSTRKLWRRCLGPFVAPACLRGTGIFEQLWNSIDMKSRKCGYPFSGLCFRGIQHASGPSFGGTFCYRRLWWQGWPSSPAMMPKGPQPSSSWPWRSGLFAAKHTFTSLSPGLQRGKRDEKKLCRMEQHRRG